jgi:hypothetical protein
MLDSLFNLVAGYFLEDNLLTQKSGDPEFEKDKTRVLKAVKLIPAEALAGMEKFPKYQDYNVGTYYDWLEGRKQLRRLRALFSKPLKVVERMQELDTDVMEEYKSEAIPIKPSLFRVKRKILLEQPLYENSIISTSEGIIEGDQLTVQSRWRKKDLFVSYSCPKRDRYAEDLRVLKQQVQAFSLAERTALKEIAESRYNYPVLFISHRWEATDHPDPQSHQLKKLKALKDCFIIYDYTSFPQAPLSATEATDLQLILQHMSRLMQNVVIIQSAEYMDRGWCLYEYIASSLFGSVVCDEIRDPKFTSLRDWVATRVPIPVNLVRDSWESQQTNFVNDSILKAVNEILPLYKKALFTVETDRKIVSSLLLRLLKEKLPAKKIHQPHLSEWKTERWTEEELKDAFENELKWEPEISTTKHPFAMNVPSTINEAVQRNYKIDKDTMLKRSMF